MDTYGERLEHALITQIRVELVEADMEQKDLADVMGMDRATLSRYMTGKRSIPMPTFYRIAAALNLSPGTLIGRAEARLPQG